MRKMKNSGIDWIGQIPSDWDTKKCKYITTFINGFPFESERLKSEYLYPVIRISDIQDGSISLDDCLGVDSNYGLASYLIKNGDILLAMSGATVGKVGIVKGDVLAYINQRVGIIRTGCPSFLFYCLSTKNFVEYVMLMSAGTAQPNISTKGFGEYPVPFPPIAEQQKIANFLDEKCGEIDSIRSDVQHEIEILNDYKKSIITEAVTKGLNPKAKLKDSGIEWVGKIPAHWECKPIGIFFREISRKNIDGAVTNSLKFTYGSIVPKPDFDADNDEYVAKTILNYNVVDFGTIMINGLNLNYDLISQRVALVQSKGIITSAYLAIKAKSEIEMNPYYAMYAFKFYDYCMAFHNMGEGVRKTLGFEELKHVYFMLPPVQEQNAIVSYLDEKCSEIDATIADKQKQLETLDEYKKSLIFEYVTGKKEVLQ